MRAVSVPGEVAFGLMLLGADRFGVAVALPVMRGLVPVAIHHGPVEAETSAQTDERRELLVRAAERAGWVVARTRSGLVDRYVFARGERKHVVMGRLDRPLFWGSTLNRVIGLVRVGPADTLSASTWSQPWTGVAVGQTWPVHSAVYVGGEVELPARPGLWVLPEARAHVLEAEVRREEAG